VSDADHASGPATPGEWRDAFDEARPAYRAFAVRVERLLEDLLDDAGLRYWYTSNDVLGLDMLVERLWARRRSGGPALESLREIPDLACVTVIAYTKRDLPDICDLVAREFEVDHDQSTALAAADLRNMAPERSERISYAHPSFVITLTDSRRTLPEWAPYADLHLQISVQTALHAAWVAINEGRAFSTDGVRPAEVRETLTQAALSFRDADSAMTEVWAAYRAVEDATERAVLDPALDVALDSTSLVTYLLRSERVGAIVSAAERIGMLEDDVPDRVGYIEDHVWTLRAAGLGTIRGLDDCLLGADGRIETILRDLHALTTETDESPLVATREDLVTMLVLILERLDAETIARARWTPRIEQALNTLVGNPGPTDR
jgi:ppGpp synthetase/RelA/SpoT-type nucleotidyltranferase